MLNFKNPVIPFWNPVDAPGFIKRTETIYAKVLMNALSERGIKNRMFESLLNGLPEGCVIAGGFMTNLLLDEKNAKDIDIFCCSEKAFIEICQLLSNPPKKEEGDDKEDPIWAYRDYKCDTDMSEFERSSQSYRFIKFGHEKRPSIQVMKMFWYDSPEHVIDTFDLTVAQVAADSKFIYLNPLTQFDLAKKRLVLHRMQFPASTIRRIIKYASKGFYACPGSLVTIATAIQEHDGVKDIDESQFVYLD